VCIYVVCTYVVCIYVVCVHMLCVCPYVVCVHMLRVCAYVSNSEVFNFFLFRIYISTCIRMLLKVAAGNQTLYGEQMLTARNVLRGPRLVVILCNVRFSVQTSALMSQCVRIIMPTNAVFIGQKMLKFT
jgi:hypothetical protein